LLLVDPHEEFYYTYSIKKGVPTRSHGA
jgi:hypothetical protein